MTAESHVVYLWVHAHIGECMLVNFKFGKWKRNHYKFWKSQQQKTMVFIELFYVQLQAESSIFRYASLIISLWHIHIVLRLKYVLFYHFDKAKITGINNSSWKHLHSIIITLLCNIEYLSSRKIIPPLHLK